MHYQLGTYEEVQFNIYKKNLIKSFRFHFMTLLPLPIVFILKEGL
jgi:hypothetical protein